MDPLTDYVREQARTVLSAGKGDLGVEQIHDTRVAIRRLRSTLRVFGPLMEDRRGAVRLERQLKWYAGLLGDIRDQQLQRARFEEIGREAGVDVGFLVERLEAEQAAREKRLRKGMRSLRFRRLRRRLLDWAAEPHLRPAADTTLDACAGAAARKVRKRLRRARSDADLHRARKAAKRARYAEELTQHRQKAAEFKHLQSVLGDLQDTVVAADTLQRLMGRAKREQAFALGVLYGRELEERERLRREAMKLAG